MVFSWPVDSRDVDRVRELAGAGQLAATYADAAADRRIELYRAVYQIACPVVFQGITVKVERQRQHGDCARGLPFLRPDCLDRFHDAVEAVVDDTVRKATVRVVRLESWMAARMRAATINSHRVRRGMRGAQQKPAVPKWLRRSLGDDPWLVELALRMLTWVGIPDTAGPGIWPVDAWADRRAVVTGDPVASEPARVRREIDAVLLAMRGRRDWYSHYVERPLDHKPVAMAPPVRADDGQFVDLPRLALVTAAELHDSALLDLAALCLDAITAGLADRDHDPAAVVTGAVRTVFCADRFDPADDADVEEMLSDPAAAATVTDLVLDIIADRRAG